MSDIARHFFDFSGFRPGAEDPQCVGLRTGLRVEGSDDVSRDEAMIIPLAADPASPLSPPPEPRHVLGVGPAGWLSAILLYGIGAAAALLAAWSVVPPDPWPETPTVFSVIFESPSPPSPPAQPEVSGISAPPDVPQPEPAAAVEPVTAPEPPSPPPPAAAPAVIAEPSPVVEPPKPRPPRPRVPVKPAREASSDKPADTASTVAQLEQDHAPRAPAAAAESAIPATSDKATTQTAALPIIPPRAVSGAAGNPKPDYPSEAKRRGLQGRVMLRVEVSPTGKALSVNVVSSSGHQTLDQAAVAGVQRWNFNPATQGGVPVAGSVDVPVQFRLED